MFSLFKISLIKYYSPKPEKQREAGASVASAIPETTTSATEVGVTGRSDTKLGTRPSSPERVVPLYDKDLIRMLAEVQFIQGEVIT